MSTTAITVTLTPEIELNRALTEAGFVTPASVTKLTVIGTCTKDDFKYMRDAMGKTLQELDLGDAVLEKNKIEKKTFYKLNILTSIVLPDTVDDIYLSAFSDCPELISITARPSNPFYASEDGVLFNKDKTVLLYYPISRCGSYTIPDSVIKIEECAFSGCSGLTSVTIPESVVSIWEDSFDENCFITVYPTIRSIKVKTGN